VLTKQPKLTAIIKSCRFTLFGHIVHMDDNADAKRILLASSLVDWRRQPTHHVARPTGSETPPPYAPQSSKYGSEPFSVEDAVDTWCYAISELHARKDDHLSSTWMWPCIKLSMGAIVVACPSWCHQLLITICVTVRIVLPVAALIRGKYMVQFSLQSIAEVIVAIACVDDRTMYSLH